MTDSIRVVQYGLGPIGCGTARLIAERAGLDLVGGIDINPAKVGQDLGDLIGLPGALGIPVDAKLVDCLQRTAADVVVHTTSSSFKRVWDQLVGIVQAGIHVVSTTEELAYPWWSAPELSRQLDRIAKDNGVSVLATGVNPGFTMDTWPLAMTAVCQEVRRVKVIRIQDASSRRLPFQKKIGAGRTLTEFQELVAAGTLRHVGLTESIAMIAAGLGWKLDDIRDDIEPIIAEERISSPYLTVEPGQAAGVKQIGRGLAKSEELISMDFQAYIGSPETYDAVYIMGTPNMEVVIKGGAHGDIATKSIAVNAIRRVVEAPPGLKTMLDLPIVTCC
jgi:hypothetical protein